MIIVSFILLVFATAGAVFVPRFAPFLLVGMYRLIEMGVHPIFVIAVCSITATMTTTGIWYLDEQLHKYLERFQKNDPEKKGVTRWLRRRFDRTFSAINNKVALFIAIMFASGSMIPDVFLVEFGRIKMKFHVFIVAIFLGKLGTYCIMIFGLDSIIAFLKKMIGI